MTFVEERLLTGSNTSSSFGEAYAVDVVETMINRYAVLRHPFVLSRFSLAFDGRYAADQRADVISVFHRVGGMAGGFRFRNLSDFSSNNYTETPTHHDQRCELISLAARTYQLMRWYAAPSATAPRRRILKPVSGSVIIGIESASGSLHQTAQSATVSTSTGVVTLPANISRSITAITKASQAVVTVGTSHGITTAQSVVFASVGGMTQINGLRGNVVSTASNTITVDINSTAFSNYTSGGTAATNPTATEYLTAGFEFDLPVMFAADLDAVWSDAGILGAGVDLIETRNPQ